jgi:hypothetical protein
VRTASIIRVMNVKIITLMMEAVRTSETLVYSETTRHYSAEGCHPHICQKFVSTDHVKITNFTEQNLHETLIVAQLMKQFPTFYQTQKFITMFTGVHH